MMVKICGITRREDAQAAVDAGASAIGFIFYKPSPRYITPDRAAALGDNVPVLKVGIFVDESPAIIDAVMREANLDIVQIYGGAAPTTARVWKAFRGIPSDQQDCEAVLLDSSQSGTTFDWREARGAFPRVIIAGGLDASNVREAIRQAEPWGVDASSRLETSPGIKDHEKIRQFIRAARQENS